MTGFVGGGAHWRVLPLRKLVANAAGQPRVIVGAWQVLRRNWDHWEAIGSPHLSHVAAMTEAHRLARLNRG